MLKTAQTASKVHAELGLASGTKRFELESREEHVIL